MARRRTRRRQPSVPKQAGAISVALQDFHIRGRFPTFAFHLNGGHAARWVGTLQPRETSQLYTVAIGYKLGRVPDVRVLSPTLQRNAPHVYPDGTLCLYWDEEWRWRRTEFIALTILPWTSLWLYHYELWLDTDEWLAPSSPHGLCKKPEVDASDD